MVGLPRKSVQVRVTKAEPPAHLELTITPGVCCWPAGPTAPPLGDDDLLPAILGAVSVERGAAGPSRVPCG